MSFTLHPTKNKHLKPGEPKYYKFVLGRDKERTTTSKQFATEADAALYHAELQRVNKPAHVRPGIMPTFSQMIPDFLDYYQNELERRPRAVTAWAAGWKQLKPFFGQIKPTQLCPDLIERYKKERLAMKAGIRNNLISKRTVQKELHNLSSLVKYAVDKNLCNPLNFKIRGFLKKHTTAAPVIPPTPDQVQEMFNQVKRTDHLDLYKSFYYTGLRNEELRMLQRKHVYLDWDILTVFGKGGKWRIVPIVAPYRAIIEGLCKDKKPDDYLLINKKTGKTYTNNCCRLDTAAKKAGIQTHITAHVLRKCFSTHAIYWGVDMRTLQLILGHAQVTTTERYTFLPPSILAEKLSMFGIDKKTEQLQAGVQCTASHDNNHEISQHVKAQSKGF